jgi:primosomal protein N' (replication factor Y) (superfamily II helicase)
MKEYFYEVCLLKSPLSNLIYKSDNLIDNGSLVKVKLRNKKDNLAVVIKNVEKPIFKCIKIDEITSKYYDEKMLKLASFISLYYVCSLGEALGIFIPFDKTLIVVEDQKKYIIFDSKIKLSLNQKKAYDFLESNKLALLFANTGSGKTQIYIKHIQKHINNSKQALLIMPEISLSTQMQLRLEEVFGDCVAIWHSKISKKRKDEIINDLLNKKIKIIAGARSSMFLPFDNLGLIIIDEEHDNSFKSDQKPRVNIKDLAIYLSKNQNIQTILGSATPSINSFFKIPYFRLKETFFKSNKNIEYFNSQLSLDKIVLKNIEKTINNNNQAIIFLPTKANFKYQVCNSCGKSIECPNCSVKLSLHKNDLVLKCHCCNYTQKIPSSCPACDIGIIHNLRIGTAQIQEELNLILPNKKIARFDTDDIKSLSKLKKVLKDFNDNKIDILIGTQMLSKGHDYHNIKLAVILGIDWIFNINSYKARENTLSLLIQIAGRSGRKGEGKVLIQTKNRDFFDIYLQKNDYEDFLKDELEYRKDLYPPYLKIARVVFSHKDELKVEQEMKSYVNILEKNQYIDIIGFGKCTIFKVANKYKYEILLRSTNINKLLTALHNITSPISYIDMDSIK